MTDPFDGLRSHDRRTPPDLAQVIAAGVHRRRRDALLLTSAVAVVAVAVGVTFGLGGIEPQALDRVVTSTPTSTPSTADTAGAAPKVAASTKPALGSGSMSSTARPGAGQPTLPPLAGSTPSARPSPPRSEPGMKRQYDPDRARVTVAAGYLCTTRVGINAGDDPYCGGGDVTAIDADNTLHLRDQMCRDGQQTSVGQFSFRNEREADFAVYRGSTLIWRWSANRQPPRAMPQALAVDPGKCWSWTTTWRAVDAKGHKLAGDYTLRTWSYPKEFAGTGYAITDYDFTL